MKTRLFNEYESYNKNADQLSIELEEAIVPILERAASKYPTRDIEVVALAAMNMLTAQIVVLTAIDQSEIDDLKEQRELLGQKVHNIWATCILDSLKHINNPQVKDWYELSSSDREICRKIGEELFEFGKRCNE